jgi:tripartite-type tricarboxylate transporter receptor subunit TctC
VPTVAEQGYPDFNAVAWFGILSPAGTPNEIVRKVHSDVAKVLSDPEFKSRVTQFGLELEEHSTPETFAAFIKQEIPRIGEIVKASGIKLDQ